MLVNAISQELLKSKVKYDPETGLFSWIKGSRAGKAGAIAGSLTKYGYIRFWIGEKIYMAHRLAWLYVHGYMPENAIDHINGIRDDNRMSNLQEVSRACNNAKCSRKPKPSGLPRCITSRGGKFRFQTGFNNEVVTGKTRETLEEAINDREEFWKKRFSHHLEEDGCKMIIDQ